MRGTLSLDGANSKPGNELLLVGLLTCIILITYVKLEGSTWVLFQYSDM